jgi:hypothetical protein
LGLFGKVREVSSKLDVNDEKMTMYDYGNGLGRKREGKRFKSVILALYIFEGPEKPRRQRDTF